MTLHAPALRQPTPVEHTLGVAAVGLIDVITAMSNAIAAGSRARHRLRPTLAGSSHRQPAGPGTPCSAPGSWANSATTHTGSRHLAHVEETFGFLDGDQDGSIAGGCRGRGTRG